MWFRWEGQQRMQLWAVKGMPDIFYIRVTWNGEASKLWVFHPSLGNRERMCPHRGQNNIEARIRIMAVHLGAQASNKSRKNKYIYILKAEQARHMGSWDWVTKQELLCLKTYTKQFERINSSFQSQPADSLQCIMALHYTHTHTSYRPFWPPFSLIILLNRAVGVLRDGVIIPPLWHLWPHFQLQSPFTALHIPKHLISDPWPLSFQEFYSSQNLVAVFRLTMSGSV